ncbi:hypothetical protein [Rathayibacter soli]|uniref:hypothetical protein n=1 Tax=Rathayibacter soli TaxID=3144168 RepID=UPI0027E52399|nr:hypothetical protein [Glaciibacter superstes]
MTTVSDRLALRAARAVIAQRGGRRGTGDIAYLTYSACLATAIAVFPVLRFIVLGLATPSVQGVIRTPATTGAVALAGSILVAGAMLVGPIRGPAVPRPFLIQYLLGSPIARRLGLRRAFLWSCAAVALLLVLTAALIAIAQAVSGNSSGPSAGPTISLTIGPSAEASSAVLFLVAAFAFSVLVSIAWLLGQAVRRWITVSAAAVILATGVLAVADLPALAFVTTNATPWGWLALSFQAATTSAPVIWPAAAMVIALVTAGSIPFLLDNVSAPKALAQSRRWQTTGMLLTTGDAAAAAGGFREPPRRGRRLRVPMGGPMPFAVFTRDILAITRFPTRLAFGIVGIVTAGWLIGICGAAPDGIRWAIALPGALLAFLSVGVWCDGLRDSSANATGASLYGWAIGPRTLAHALAPAAAAILFGGVGALLGGTGLDGGAASAASVSWWILLAAFIVVVRVYDSAKGPLPVLLLTPVVTPAGDLSVLNVLLWQSDAVLLTLALGGGLTVAFYSGAAGAVSAVTWLGLGGVVIALLALRRLRVMSRPA